MKIAIYPGSFDPVTNGHLDIIHRSCKVFDKVYVSVLENEAKKPSFSLKERLDMLRTVTKDVPNVEVGSFSGMLMQYADLKQASVIVKGLRAVSDFEYEFQMALVNKKLNPNVETLFMMTNSEFSYLSSSIVRDIARLGGNIEGLVPNIIIESIMGKLNNGGR